MKLNQYVDNLYATQETMGGALEYARSVANSCMSVGTDNYIAIMTAVHVVLNTAISMHRTELAAVNKPLIELIDGRVAAAVADLQSGIDDQVSEAINDLDLDDKIQGWFDSNFDIESALSGTSISITFD
jgi:citrate lyase alpha subunit